MMSRPSLAVIQAALQRMRDQTPPDLACPECGCLGSANAIEQLGRCCDCDDARKEGHLRDGALDFLPLQWRGISSNPHPTQREAFAAAGKWFESGAHGWLYIYGPPGAGKSYLAALLAPKLQDRGRVMWLSYPEFAPYRYGEAEERLKDASTVSNLLIDDLGAGEVRSPLLGPLLNSRLTAKLLTVITTNVYLRKAHKRDGLLDPSEVYGRYVAERLLEGVSAYIYMGGPNMRLQKGL